MKKSLFICLSLFLTVNTNSQVSFWDQAITDIDKVAQSEVFYDKRYEGVKGSPRLTDTLLPSLVKLAGQDSFFNIRADLDLVDNTLIYAGSKSDQMFSIKSSNVSELVINKDGNELLFRTTKGKKFDKDLKESRFYQVLSEGEYEFIKVPMKNLIGADYTGAYTANRRYDEFYDETRYYLKGRDGTYYQVELKEKSLIKVIPEKKEIIKQAFSKGSSEDKESLVISILRQN